jgi:flagellar hook assembly protein FlgD
VLLSYRLGADASVQVRIVTLLGELVRELSFPAGAAGGTLGLNEIPWDGRNGSGATVKPGVYVAHIESGAGGVNEAVKVGVRR